MASKVVQWSVLVLRREGNGKHLKKQSGTVFVSNIAKLGPMHALGPVPKASKAFGCFAAWESPFMNLNGLI